MGERSGLPSLSVEELIEALKDENGYVRLNAAIALGEKGDKEAVGPLIDL
jgi:HEAT repeat protein